MAKTVKQQIKKLKNEEINNIPKVHKKYIISLLSVFIIGIIVITIVFSYATLAKKVAEDRYDFLEETIQSNIENNIEDDTLYDESYYFLSKYHSMKTLQKLSIPIGLGMIIIFEIITVFIFKKKYPYYNREKFLYLKNEQL